MTEPSKGQLSAPGGVINAGVEVFAAELDRQGISVERVDWAPPLPGGELALRQLAPSTAAIAAANDEAMSRMQAARPVLRGIGTAGDLVPDMDERTILHAGPPIEWSDMAGPMRGAIIGAALYEGLASDPDEAANRATSGAFEFAPCHERGVVGPMAGVLSHSMPVWIVENDARGNRAYCSLNEGLGRVLRYGAYDDEVIDRLRWMGAVLAPVLATALEQVDEPLDLRALIAQAIQMGDDCHNRCRAATSLLLRELAVALLAVSDHSSADLSASAKFIAGNDHFFLNLAMPAAKSIADAAAGVEGSTIVTALSRNGVEFGIRVSGTGDRWFTGPAAAVEGLYLPGFGPKDANLDIGDSAITETVGLGGFVMAAAPAIVSFVGGEVDEAMAATEAMYEITWSESESFRIPALGFRGSPIGIDSRAVVQTGVMPRINTGIAHREPGVGQIGAGLVTPPADPFVAAMRHVAGSARKQS